MSKKQHTPQPDGSHAHGGVALPLLFIVALFTSALLMFSLQPMAGRMLLPLVGGAPAGWIVAMAFFQLSLLAGYLAAYGLSCLPPRLHAAGYLALLAAGACVLPVALAAPGDGTGGDSTGAGGAFALLAAGTGLPFVALAATATTLQRFFSLSRHPNAHDPYFLYGASNLGSFAGLLAYPLWAEPALTLGQQAAAWHGAYLALPVLALLCALAVRAPAPRAAAGHAAMPLHLWPAALRWTVCAFIPASLLMGYTGFITQMLSSAPLLWVVPLSIYLCSFIVAFHGRTQGRGTRLWPLHLLGVAASLGLILWQPAHDGKALWPVIVHLLALGAIATAFHRFLYSLRPDARDSRKMAVFYLMIAGGGALAGAFNAFAAPVIFDGMYELPLVLVLSLACTLSPRPLARRSRQAVLVAALGASLLAVSMTHKEQATVWQARNFYGTVTVSDHTYTDRHSQAVTTRRILQHGRVAQGAQVLSGPEKLQPPAYYRSVKPVFDHYAPANVLVIGLGTGGMSCFGTRGSAFTYIDIDPAIIAAAQKYFSYLAECPAARPPRIIQGDGRIAAASLQERFDLIVVDVFSSAHIPAHMLTREAIEIYRSKLATGGVILFHVSSRFFDLAPVLAAAAADAGLQTRMVERSTLDGHTRLDIPSRWVAMAQDATPFDGFHDFDWRQPATSTRMWRDDRISYRDVWTAGIFTTE